MRLVPRISTAIMGDSPACAAGTSWLGPHSSGTACGSIGQQQLQCKLAAPVAEPVVPIVTCVLCYGNACSMKSANAWPPSSTSAAHIPSLPRNMNMVHRWRQGPGGCLNCVICGLQECLPLISLAIRFAIKVRRPVLACGCILGAYCFALTTVACATSEDYSAVESLAKVLLVNTCLHTLVLSEAKLDDRALQLLADSIPKVPIARPRCRLRL